MKLLPLDKVTADQVLLFNRVVGRCRSSEILIGKESLSLLFFAEPAVNTFEQAIKIKIGGSTAWIALTGLDRLCAIHEILGNAQFSELPADVQAALIDVICEPILDQVEGIIGRKLDILEIAAPDAMEKLDLQLNFVLMQNGKPKLYGKLCLPTDLLESVVMIADRIEPAQCNNLAEIPIAGLVSIGSGRITLRELREIEPFDVMLMDISSLDAGALIGEKRVQLQFAPLLTYQAKLKESLLVIDRLEQSATNCVPVESQCASCPMSDELTVDLTFSLGEIHIPLGKLVSLQPGGTLPFSPSQEYSYILAAGHTLGYGELVSVGSRIGVRFLHSVRDHATEEDSQNPALSFQADCSIQ